MSNIYVTDGYSIENELSSVALFRRVLEEVYGVSALTPAEVAIVQALFEDNVATFVRALTPIMCQIIAWQRNGSRPPLGNIAVKDYFSYADGRAQVRPEFTGVQARLDHSAQCAGLAAIDLAVIHAIEAEFRAKHGPDRFVRGKYFLWFFLECANQLHLNVGKILSRPDGSPKVKVSLGPKNAMVVIAPRLRCPNSLREFVSRTFLSFAKRKVSPDPPSWKDTVRRWMSIIVFWNRSRA